MANFDEHGHLLPYEITELSLSDFEAAFVGDLADRTHRQALFADYLRFVGECRKTFKTSFFQWIGGSFVTTKEVPGDLDCVTFLPYDLMAKNLGAIDLLRRTAKTNFQVDAAFSSTCKWNHRFYVQSKDREEFWRKLYGFSRPVNTGLPLPKGIIKINFSA